MTPLNPNEHSPQHERDLSSGEVSLPGDSMRDSSAADPAARDLRHFADAVTKVLEGQRGNDIHSSLYGRSYGAVDRAIDHIGVQEADKYKSELLRLAEIDDANLSKKAIDALLDADREIGTTVVASWLRQVPEVIYEGYVAAAEALADDPQIGCYIIEALFEARLECDRDSTRSLYEMASEVASTEAGVTTLVRQLERCAFQGHVPPSSRVLRSVDFDIRNPFIQEALLEVVDSVMQNPDPERMGLLSSALDTLEPIATRPDVLKRYVAIFKDGKFESSRGSASTRAAETLNRIDDPAVLEELHRAVAEKDDPLLQQRAIIGLSGRTDPRTQRVLNLLSLGHNVGQPGVFARIASWARERNLNGVDQAVSFLSTRPAWFGSVPDFISDSAEAARSGEPPEFFGRPDQEAPKVSSFTPRARVEAMKLSSKGSSALPDALKAELFGELAPSLVDLYRTIENARAANRETARDPRLAEESTLRVQQLEVNRSNQEISKALSRFLMEYDPLFKGLEEQMERLSRSLDFSDDAGLNFAKAVRKLEAFETSSLGERVFGGGKVEVSDETARDLTDIHQAIQYGLEQLKYFRGMVAGDAAAAKLVPSEFSAKLDEASAAAWESFEATFAGFPFNADLNRAQLKSLREGLGELHSELYEVTTRLRIINRVLFDGMCDRVESARAVLTEAWKEMDSSEAQVVKARPADPVVAEVAPEREPQVVEAVAEDPADLSQKMEELFRELRDLRASHPVEIEEAARMAEAEPA